MGGATGGREVGAKHALLPDGQLVLCRLTVDQEAPARLERRGCRGSLGTVLLAHHEKEPDPVLAGSAQALGGGDHRGGEPLGITGAAAMKPGLVLPQVDEGRHGVEVGGKHHHRLAQPGIDIEPVVEHRLAHHDPATLFQEPGEELGHGAFPAGGRIDAHERTREFEDVHA